MFFVFTFQSRALKRTKQNTNNIKSNKPYFLYCANSKNESKSTVVERHQSWSEFVWWLCCKNKKNFTQLWYLLNCRSTFHVHKIKVSKIRVDGRVWVCEYCAHVALEGIHQPHFHFCSISARISVIPLKSRGSPTVTSHNGANAGVVGTQLRLLGSIWFTFPIPQPVCMQT